MQISNRFPFSIPKLRDSDNVLECETTNKDLVHVTDDR